MRLNHWFILVVVAVLSGAFGCSSDDGVEAAPDTDVASDTGDDTDGTDDADAPDDVADAPDDVVDAADIASDGDVSDADAADVEAETDVADASDLPPDVSPDLADVDAADIPDEDVPASECNDPVNADHRQELLDAQPAIEVRSRSVLTATATWASLGDHPEELCSVSLQFRDSNGSGTLEPYEDWTRSPEERAADLVPRMSAAEKLGLMAHATTNDAPSSDAVSVSEALQALIVEHVRFAEVTVRSGLIEPRASWANNVQELCEASEHGVPFVLSMAPAHSDGNGLTRSFGFSRWPQELGLAAIPDDLGYVETFGTVVAQEYGAIGIRMALSPNADLATEPRWYRSQFTFGEDATAVTERVVAYIDGLQGEALGPGRVAAVVRSFPGDGPARDGWDPQLEKGTFLTYPGDQLDTHLAPFAAAFDQGVAAVMLSHGVLETGQWTALDGVLNGQTIEQVGAAFNATLVTGAVRVRYGFDGLVIAPPGVLDDDGTPWGVEDRTPAERVALAVDAGVDQFAALNDLTPLEGAKTAGDLTDAQVDAAARRALVVMFRLGLFENPYVDPAQAPALTNTGASNSAGLLAMYRSMVLLVNATKPDGWLNGAGDGTQVGDRGNAGNGTGRVLPAPPGEPYISAGCSFFLMGDFDIPRVPAEGYGLLTNGLGSIDGTVTPTDADRIPLSDYVFIRIPAPYTADPDSGDLGYPLSSLAYAGNDNGDVLDDLAFARAAIDAAPTSQTQIVVGIDAGRVSVVNEILSYGVSGLYIEWGVTRVGQPEPDKVFLDVAFGLANGRGRLPVGLPASDAAAANQLEDVAGDGQHATFVEGFGIDTNAF